MKKKILELVFLAMVGTYSASVYADLSSEYQTGSCGFYFSTNVLDALTLQDESVSIGDTHSMNVLGIIDFANNKVQWTEEELLAVADNENNGDPYDYEISVTTYPVVAGTSYEFTIEEDTHLANAAIFTFTKTDDDNETVQGRLLSVNGGNTFLIQGISFVGGGVCQKT